MFFVIFINFLCIDTDCLGTSTEFNRKYKTYNINFATKRNYYFDFFTLISLKLYKIKNLKKILQKFSFSASSYQHKICQKCD